MPIYAFHLPHSSEWDGIMTYIIYAFSSPSFINPRSASMGKKDRRGRPAEPVRRGVLLRQGWNEGRNYLSASGKGEQANSRPRGRHQRSRLSASGKANSSLNTINSDHMNFMHRDMIWSILRSRNDIYNICISEWNNHKCIMTYLIYAFSGVMKSIMNEWIPSWHI